MEFLFFGKRVYPVQSLCVVERAKGAKAAKEFLFESSAALSCKNYIIEHLPGISIGVSLILVSDSLRVYR